MKPLLYIVQPRILDEQPYMQQVFKSKKKDEKLEIEQTIEEIDAQTFIVENIHTTARKPFKQMTIIEKLNYLQNLPFYIPNVFCTFEIKEKSFKGVLQSVELPLVTIRKEGGEIEKVLCEEIKNIFLNV